MGNAFQDRMEAYKQQLLAMQNDMQYNPIAVQSLLNRIQEMLDKNEMILKYHEEAQQPRPRNGQSDNDEALKRMQEDDERRRLEEEKRRLKAAEAEAEAIRRAIADLEKQAKLEKNIVAANATVVEAEAALAAHQETLQAQQQEIDTQTKKLDLVDMAVVGVIASQAKAGEMFKSLQLKMGSLKKELEEISKKIATPDALKSEAFAQELPALQVQSELLNTSLQAVASELKQIEGQQTELGAQLSSLKEEFSSLSDTISALKNEMQQEEEKTSGLLGEKIDAVEIAAKLGEALKESKAGLAESKVVGLARSALGMEPRPEGDADKKRKEKEAEEKRSKTPTPTPHPPGMGG